MYLTLHVMAFCLFITPSEFITLYLSYLLNLSGKQEKKIKEKGKKIQIKWFQKSAKH